MRSQLKRSLRYAYFGRNCSRGGLLLKPTKNGHFFPSSLLRWLILSSKNCANSLFYDDGLQQTRRSSWVFRVFSSIQLSIFY